LIGEGRDRNETFQSLWELKNEQNQKAVTNDTINLDIRQRIGIVADV
jgi:hypothetical protein